MSPERKTTEVDPERLWKKVLVKEQEGSQLTEDEKRALLLRKTCLSTVGAIAQIIDDPSLSEDVVRHAQVIAQYWEGLSVLEDERIEKRMHVGEDSDSFKNPVVMVEWLGGQLIDVCGEEITTARQAIAQVQEHSSLDTRISAMNASLMDAKSITPSFRNWLTFRTAVNVTRRFLAFELDRPQPVQ